MILFLVGFLVAFILGIYVVMKKKGCDFMSAFSILCKIISETLFESGNTFFVITDDIFCMEIDNIISKYSSISPEHTYRCNRKADLPYFVCQIICPEEKKTLIDNLIKKSVSFSLARNVETYNLFSEWTEIEGISSVIVYYSSTINEQKILENRIKSNKISKLNNPVVDKELEQEMRENNC